MNNCQSLNPIYFIDRFGFSKELYKYIRMLLNELNPRATVPYIGHYSC